jgi:hypothetical protein
LDERGVIEVLELLKNIQLPFDGGGNDGAFEDIGHVAHNAVPPLRGYSPVKRRRAEILEDGFV